MRPRSTLTLTPQDSTAEQTDDEPLASSTDQFQVVEDESTKEPQQELPQQVEEPTTPTADTHSNLTEAESIQETTPMASAARPFEAEPSTESAEETIDQNTLQDETPADDNPVDDKPAVDKPVDGKPVDGKQALDDKPSHDPTPDAQLATTQPPVPHPPVRANSLTLQTADQAAQLHRRSTSEARAALTSLSQTEFSSTPVTHPSSTQLSAAQSLTSSQESLHDNSIGVAATPRRIASSSSTPRRPDSTSTTEQNSPNRGLGRPLRALPTPMSESKRRLPSPHDSPVGRRKGLETKSVSLDDRGNLSALLMDVAATSSNSSSRPDSKDPFIIMQQKMYSLTAELATAKTNCNSLTAALATMSEERDHARTQVIELSDLHTKAFEIEVQTNLREREWAWLCRLLDCLQVLLFHCEWLVGSLIPFFFFFWFNTRSLPLSFSWCQQSMNSMLTEQLAATKASMVNAIREINETHARQTQSLQAEVSNLRTTTSTSVADKDTKIGKWHTAVDVQLNERAQLFVRWNFRLPFAFVLPWFPDLYLFFTPLRSITYVWDGITGPQADRLANAVFWDEAELRKEFRSVHRKCKCQCKFRLMMMERLCDQKWVGIAFKGITPYFALPLSSSFSSSSPLSSCVWHPFSWFILSTFLTAHVSFLTGIRCGRESSRSPWKNQAAGSRVFAPAAR
jgi:hypothetical protein